jgi:hypothetical protein
VPSPRRGQCDLRNAHWIAENADHASISQTHIPTCDPHHIVYPSVSTTDGADGVLAATAPRAAHSTKPIKAPAPMSRRPRRKARSIAAKSTASSAMQETKADSRAGSRTSYWRCQRSAGT